MPRFTVFKYFYRHMILIKTQNFNDQNNYFMTIHVTDDKWDILKISCTNSNFSQKFSYTILLSYWQLIKLIMIFTIA